MFDSVIKLRLFNSHSQQILVEDSFTQMQSVSVIPALEGVSVKLDMTNSAGNLMLG